MLEIFEKWYDNMILGYLARQNSVRRISGTILMAIEVAPREALRNGTVLCKEVEDFVGNVSDKASIKMLEKRWGFGFLFVTKVHIYLSYESGVRLTVLGVQR